MTTIDDVRCGVIRDTMQTNALLQKAPLGKPKKLLFNKPSEAVTFGIPGRSGREESARDVTMTWKEHEPNPNARPGPDFKAMNKAASHHGLTKAVEMRPFRETHYIQQKHGFDKIEKAAAVLPSDVDLGFSYGCPSSHKPLEEFRRSGVESKMQDLIQGRFMHDWVKDHITDSTGTVVSSKLHLVPRDTTAARGHREGAMKKLAAEVEKSSWKMNKFSNVPSKILT